jgi:hypothetical protein
VFSRGRVWCWWFVGVIDKDTLIVYVQVESSQLDSRVLGEVGAVDLLEASTGL